MDEAKQPGGSSKRFISPSLIAFFGWGLLGTYPVVAILAAVVAALSLPQNFRLVGALFLFFSIGVFPASKIWKSTGSISRNWLKKLMKGYVILGLLVTFVGPVVATAFLAKGVGQLHTLNFSPKLVINDKDEINRALVNLGQHFEDVAVEPKEVLLSSTYTRSDFLEDEYQSDLIFRISLNQTEELLSKIELPKDGYGKPELMADINLTSEIDCNELGINHYCDVTLFQTSTKHAKYSAKIDSISFLVFEPSTRIFWYQRREW